MLLQIIILKLTEREQITLRCREVLEVEQPSESTHYQEADSATGPIYLRADLSFVHLFVSLVLQS